MHKIILILFIVFGFIILSEDIFGQEAYKSVDERGTINFSDNPTSPVLEKKKGPRKEDGAEVLNRNEMGNRPSVMIVGGKTTILTIQQDRVAGQIAAGEIRERSGREDPDV
jgi:hypothetical protein